MIIKAELSNGQLHIYDDIRNLSFAPEADVTGQSLPINEFSADIYTRDDITAGNRIQLLDERLVEHEYEYHGDTVQETYYNVWALYWITQADRISDEVVRVQAQTVLGFQYNRTQRAVMCNNTPVADLLPSIFYIDPTFASATITGYLPEQTMRERLQHIAFAIGAYVKTFDELRPDDNPLAPHYVHLLPLKDTTTNIPSERTYWRPSLSTVAYVKSITMTAFSFTQGTPQSGEESVEADGVTYIVTRQEVTLQNPDIPITALEGAQEMKIGDVYIVNSGNVDDILSRLARFYFKNQELDADIINNKDYLPGQKVEIMIDPPEEENPRVAVGYIESCDFAFGLQSKSRIHMRVQELRDATALTVNYMHGQALIGYNIYHFPVGYSYSVSNPYLDQSKNGHRYIYYPLLENATGTMQQSENVNNQSYAVALDNDLSEGTIEILSVSNLTISEPASGTGERTVTIG